MGVGPKIKEYRNKEGLTQKDLADRLHVTYQAVSRWEKDEVEPSIDTLKEMCNIFNCSIDDLLGMEKKVEDKPIEENNSKVIEKVIVKETRPVLAVCEKCNKPIYNDWDLKRIDASHTVRGHRRRHTTTRQMILCNKCFELRIKEQKEKQNEDIMAKNQEFKVRRIHSIIWPALISLIFIIIGIVSLTNGDTKNGVNYIVFGIFFYFFLATMILNNTFITDMWFKIASWGFVKMPGIIFSFDFDGLIFLIVAKIIMFILGILLATASIILATVVAMLLSIFAYPFALKRNINCVEYY